MFSLDQFQTQVWSLLHQLTLPFSSAGIFSELQQWRSDSEFGRERSECFDPTGPLGHAGASQSPAAATGPAEDIPHQHAKRSCCSVQTVRLARAIAGFGEPWIKQGDLMTMPAEVPGGAGANGTSTDDGNGAIQLRASLGIKAE